MAARVVMLLGRRGAANSRYEQRRSLKIESICALGLEIQIRREISMAARILSLALCIIDRSIERRSPRVADAPDCRIPLPLSPVSVGRLHLTGRNDVGAKILHYAGFWEIKGTADG